MNEECCSICLDSLRQEQPEPQDKRYLKVIKKQPTIVCVLPTCGHLFHSTCILTHLINNSKCPNCRASVVVEKLIFLPNQLFHVAPPRAPTEMVIVPTNTQDQLRMAGLMRDLQNQSDQIEQLQLQIEETAFADNNGEELEELETQIQLLSNRLATMNSDFKAASAKILDLKANLHSHKCRVTQLEAEVEVFSFK
jgi:hypothetical protein